MSWSEGRPDRRAVIASLGGLAALTALGGCFRPMLAEGAPARQLQGQIALPAIGDRFSYYLYKSLANRLGEPVPDPKFRLAVKTALIERGLLIRPDATVTRTQLTATATWTLFRAADPKVPVASGTLVSESGFDQTSSLYASRVTRRQVEENLAGDLGQRIALGIEARAPGLLAAK